MNSFAELVKRSLLGLLAALGASLLVIGCSYVITLIYDVTGGRGLWSIVVLGLVLFSYLGALIAGAIAMAAVKSIVSRDLRLLWLPLLCLSAAMLCFGYFILTEHLFLERFPNWLDWLIDNLVTMREATGVYCMLFGGTMLWQLFYSDGRLFCLINLVRMALQIIIVSVLLLFFTNACVDGDLGDSFAFMNMDIPTFLAYPAVLGCLILMGLSGVAIPYTFAYGVGGHMEPFFPLMYVLASVTGLAGLFLGLNSTVLPMVTIDPLSGTVGLLLGIGLVVLGIVWIAGTRMVLGECCSRCGLYAYEERISLGRTETHTTDGYKTKYSTLSDVTVYSNGLHYDRYDDEERMTRTVHYEEKKRVVCRYCDRDYGVFTYNGSYQEEVVTSRGSHGEWRYH